MPPKKDDRERLLIEAAQRDPARFVELYEENFERVYAYVSRRVHLRADAEDVTAEVFQQALANLAKFEWRGVPFAAWLYRIAGNALADRWQKVSRESGKPAAEIGSVEVGESEIEMAELRAQVFRSVANLPEDQRRVIEMRFAEEKSIREIAKELGRSTGAVKQLQFRAYQKLREQASRNFRNRPGGRNG